MFERFSEKLGKSVGFYVAFKNGEAIASALLISDTERAYYLVGGREPGSHNSASALLHWTAMIDMKRAGVAVYDFVGGRTWPVANSRQEGLQLFKSRFGADYHKGMLWKASLSRWRYGLQKSSGQLRDALNRNRFNEDMIDNDIRTAGFPRSQLVGPH